MLTCLITAICLKGVFDLLVYCSILLPKVLCEDQSISFWHLYRVWCVWKCSMLAKFCYLKGYWLAFFLVNMFLVCMENFLWLPSSAISRGCYLLLFSFSFLFSVCLYVGAVGEWIFLVVILQFCILINLVFPPLLWCFSVCAVS